MAISFGEKKSQEHRLELIRTKEEEEIAKKTADLFGLPYIDLAFKPIQREAVEVVPELEARRANISVIQKSADSMKLVLLDPEDNYAKEIMENLQKKFKEIAVFVVSSRSLKKAWANYPTAEAKEKISGQVAISQKSLEQFKESIASISDLKKNVEMISAQKNVSSIVELLLASALSLKASDIHVEPEEQNIHLRLRIDGMMHDVAQFDLRIYNLLLSRVKLLSAMKLNIHNVAQGGRFSVTFENFEIQIRASILPGEYGENIVLRVLNPESLLSVEDLGIREDLLKIIEAQVSRPNGMILVTGPTGSGKTTTLYAFLKKLAKPESKIITVEDPIEYHLPGISQTQVAPDVGYTFSSGLKAILRQDPNIILVGEIRDFETADTALQASLTGHLLLSTLHTNDAAGVIPRLVDLGVNASAIGPALNMAIAQRLIRKVCGACNTTRNANPEEFALFKSVLGDHLEKDLRLPVAKGCGACNDNGYQGRIGVFEILVSSIEFERFIAVNPSITEIRNFLKETGMTSLRYDGFLKIMQGVTTLEEVNRIVGE
jgi:type IV pilus assembly protein PilB